MPHHLAQHMAAERGITLDAARAIVAGIGVNGDPPLDPPAIPDPAPEHEPQRGPWDWLSR